MIELAKNEEMRSARNLLTVAVLDKLVHECLGVVPVLCIVGKARSGKTWAAEDWFTTRDSGSDLAGYLDCKGTGFGGPGSLRVGGVLRALRSDDYPKFALDGVDIVIVDEGQFRPVMVNKLIENTAPEAGTAAHRLVVLLVQNLEHVALFDFGKKRFMTYNTAGVPI